MNTVFLPLLVQLGMTFVILLSLPSRRISDLKANPALYKRAGTDNSVYSEKSQQIANAFANQLQLPILFYIACIFAIMFGATGFWAGLFAWAFVATRIVHAFIHVTFNNVRMRFLAFVSGVVMLICFWVVVVAAASGSPLLTGANPLTSLGG